MKHITSSMIALMGVLFMGARPMAASSLPAVAASVVVLQSDSLSMGVTTPQLHTSATVYRIQVYSGNNGRKSKEEAYRMAALSKDFFPLLPTHCSYKQPRWICHVGNFRTLEDAQHYLKLMRGTTQFPYATIVKARMKASAGANPVEDHE